MDCRIKHGNAGAGVLSPRRADALAQSHTCANTRVDFVWGPASRGQRMDRRRFVISTAAAALAAAPAFAQGAFPSHAITIVNAFPPGGLNDIVTRPLATAMEPILKQPVVVETKAGAPAIVAILGNNAQVTTQSVSASLPHIKAGKLRPLATFGATRSKSLPDVPTLKELGFDVEYYLWVGIFAPKGTPDEIVTTLRGAIDKAAHSAEFIAALANAGQELAYLDGPDFQTFWDVDGRRTDEAVISIGRQG